MQSVANRPASISRRLSTLAVGFGAATICALVPAGAHAAGNSHAGEHASAKSTAAHTSHSKGSDKAATKSTSHGSSVSLHDHRWQAQADPDGMENGGVDQPGGQGGTVGQQDGNNGSGNDADCEDDNRGRGIPGHCKTKDDREHQTGRDEESEDAPTELVEAPVESVVTPDEESVLAPAGETVEESVAGPLAAEYVLSPSPLAQGAAAAGRASSGVLPNTGAGDALTWLALAGALAMGAGSGTIAVARRIR
jgi:LPXTG-motif cell wall-anchored protein